MRLKKELQKRFINFLTKHLFNGITEEDIIRPKADGIYLDEKKLDQQEIDALREEADKLKNSFIWKRLMKDRIRFVANRRMYEKGMGIEDLIFGKAMLYNLEILGKFLIVLSKLK